MSARKVPVFFEAWDSHNYQELQICRKTMRAMLKLGISPLPFASKVDDVKSALASLKTRNLEPGIFIINTYWAEEQLLQLDPLMPEHAPALYFRRGLCASTKTHELLSENTGTRLSRWTR
ncbi:MAG TPA: hypothetical protein VEJ63_19555 [Planctomycetota bacterium]|nr:hypothetical protein [Planctomycetota bacterium]